MGPVGKNEPSFRIGPQIIHRRKCMLGNPTRSGFPQRSHCALSFPERNTYREPVHGAIKYVYAEHANEGFIQSTGNQSNSPNTKHENLITETHTES